MDMNGLAVTLVWDRRGELPLNFLVTLAPSPLCIPGGLGEWYFLEALPRKIMFCVFWLDTVYLFQHAHIPSLLTLLSVVCQGHGVFFFFFFF